MFILGVMGSKPSLKSTAIPYLPKRQWSSALSDQKTTETRIKNKLIRQIIIINKYDSRHITCVMWPQDISLRSVWESCSNGLRKTKVIFIIYADTHPIFLPVWVQTVVYCFNNIASAQRTGTKSWCGLLNYSIQNIQQHNNTGCNPCPILHQLTKLFCTCRNTYLCLFKITHRMDDFWL